MLVIAARRIGLARGTDREIAAQNSALRAAGCVDVITIGRAKNILGMFRPDDPTLRPGDTLVVCDLSALFASLTELPRRFRQADAKNVIIEVLDPPFSTANPDVRNMLKAWLDLRGRYMSEKLRKREQKLQPEGRLRKLSAADWPRVKMELKTETKAELSRRYGVTRQTLYRFIELMDRLEGAG